MRAAAILLAVCLSGCADPAADKARQAKAERRAASAIQDIVCAKDRSDIAVAVSLLVDEAEQMDETREDTLQQMVERVDCERS